MGGLMADVRAPRLAVIPGSFDPVTNGHLDVITRAAALFDRIVVAVATNPAKEPWFAVDERMALLRDALHAAPERGAIEVDAFEGLVAEYVRRRQAVAVVRGLRSPSELADETQMARMNRHLYDRFETVFLVADASVAHISSRLVKEIATLGGSLDGLVPPVVAARLARRRAPAPTIRI
jgi:pantetheine-phosphate adenylyltransferase